MEEPLLLLHLETRIDAASPASPSPYFFRHRQNFGRWWALLNCGLPRLGSVFPLDHSHADGWCGVAVGDQIAFLAPEAMILARSAVVTVLRHGLHSQIPKELPEGGRLMTAFAPRHLRLL
jgi:hypothetical protein